MKAQNRYKPNSGLDGRKEREGFVCASGTTKYCTHCVAVRINKHDVGIRDTKDTADTTLTFSREEWGAFIKGVKEGEFDLI